MLHKILLPFIMIRGFILIRSMSNLLLQSNNLITVHIHVLYIVFDVLLLAAGLEFPSGR